MIDIDVLNDKLLLSIGLANALKKTAWHLQDIPMKYWEDFNAVLALIDCLQTVLSQAHGIIKAEV